jgi:hypothetical protein
MTSKYLFEPQGGQWQGWTVLRQITGSHSQPQQTFQFRVSADANRNPKFRIEKGNNLRQVARNTPFGARFLVRNGGNPDGERELVTVAYQTSWTLRHTSTGRTYVMRLTHRPGVYEVSRQGWVLCQNIT